MFENVEISEILEEYNKFVLGGLINMKYNFSKCRKMVREFCKNDNVFNYNEEQTDIEIAKNIENYINNSLNSSNVIKSFE